MSASRFSISILLIGCFTSLNLVLIHGLILSTQELQNEVDTLLYWDVPDSSGLEYDDFSYTSAWFAHKVPLSKLRTITAACKRGEPCANMNLKVRAAQRLLVQILGDETKTEDFLRLAYAFRDHPEINSGLWLESFIAAKLKRSDMKDVKIPSLVELVPKNMITTGVINAAIEKMDAEDFSDECIVMDETWGEDNGPENAMWYFREDPLSNSHHWYWHLFNGLFQGRDRQGELFYFMHHELLARYNTERMANGFAHAEAYPLQYDVPMEGYNSHLTEANSNEDYTPRETGTFLNDIVGNFVFPFTSVNETIQFRKRLMEGIEAGYLLRVNGFQVPLNNFEGINFLGGTTEANVFNVNLVLYGAAGFHNTGHPLIAASMDPNNTLGLPVGVMGFTATSIRDPIFFQFHGDVENLFREHKNQLEPYAPSSGDFPLLWDGVRITGFEIIPESSELAVNELSTFWSYKEINFTKGLDFFRNETEPPILVCLKHLDHIEFDYKIIVESSVEFPTNATVHLFMAPRFDEAGNRFTMNEQRQLFFGLDLFPITLYPGENTIVRSSLDSILTMPFQSWEELESQEENSHCGCGWPHHLLIPKGSTEGVTYDVFAMVTEGLPIDGVESSEFWENTKDGCIESPLWCGVLGEPYPSKFPMGYPFDRRPYTVDGEMVDTLEDYVSHIPNMIAIQPLITFHE